MALSEKNIRRLLIIAIIFFMIIALEIYVLDIGILKISKELFYTKSIIIFLYYELSLFFSILALSLIFFIKDKKIFILLFSFLILTYSINKTYLFINGSGFGFKELQVFIHEAGHFASDAFLAYGRYFYYSFAIVIGMVAISFFIRKYIVTFRLYLSSLFIAIIIVFAMLTSYSIWYKTAGYLNNFPTPFKIMNTVFYHMGNSIYFGDREALAMEPNKTSKYDNIIWIIDESIGGAYLSINGNSKQTTPFLDSIQDQFINLGLASSGANCSADSHLILMSGIQLNQLPDEQNISLKRSSIFQYAKKAGYRTHYISGQSEDKILQNYLSEYDLEDIDNFYQPPKGFNYIPFPLPESDLIQEINTALLENKKNFLFVVKRGAHFHWEKNSYPESERAFHPSLESGDPLIKENRTKAINSYQNSILWTVDKFFESLLPLLNFPDRDDTILFYTSDHGQSIIENDRFSTHCDSTDPHLNQGIVPFLIFPKSAKSLFTSKVHKNHYNHYQLFPSTVKLMGYDQYENGNSIFENPAKKQIFFSGDLFGRVGGQRNNIKSHTSPE